MDVYQEYIADRETCSPVTGNVGIYDTTIYPEQALEDIAVLEYLLTSVYSGKDCLKKAGVDIPRKLEPLREEIAAEGRGMNKGAFFDRLCQALEAIQDYHLVFALPCFHKVHAFCRHHTVYFADMVLENHNGRLRVAASGADTVACGDVVAAGEEQLFPTTCGRFLYGQWSRDPIGQIPCLCNGEQKLVPVSPAADKPVRPSALWSHERRGGIDIVTLNRLSAFTPQEKREMTDFIAFGQTLRDAHAIILDIRGNYGGDFSCAQSFVENLNGQAGFNGHYAKLDSQGSCLAEIGLYAPDREAYETARQEILRNPTAVWRCADAVPVGKGTYPNRLLILADKNTASSAEMLIKCLKDNIPQSLLIGENTKGELNTGDIRYFYLPHSLIFLNIPTALFAGIFEEGTGFLPDFWSKGDALQTALDYLAGGQPAV